MSKFKSEVTDLTTYMQDCDGEGISIESDLTDLDYFYIRTSLGTLISVHCDISSVIELLARHLEDRKKILTALSKPGDD